MQIRQVKDCKGQMEHGAPLSPPMDCPMTHGLMHWPCNYTARAEALEVDSRLPSGVRRGGLPAQRMALGAFCPSGISVTNLSGSLIALKSARAFSTSSGVEKRSIAVAASA